VKFYKIEDDEEELIINEECSSTRLKITLLKERSLYFNFNWVERDC
jgi:hypothetical protein